MSVAAPQVPGLYFSAERRPAAPSPLRSDVAGFIGRTRRGPVGVPVRVEGWREYLNVFGGLDRDADTPYAVRGYFENEGQVAWVVRVNPTPLANVASTVWEVGGVDPATNAWIAGAPSGSGFDAATYRIEAQSPGRWADGATIHVRYRRGGFAGRPELTIIVSVPDEVPEYFTGVDPGRLVATVAQSQFVRAVPLGATPQSAGTAGPSHLYWTLPPLHVSPAPPPAGTGDSKVAYLDALIALGDQVEVALLALPDLYRDLPPAVGVADGHADDVAKAAMRLSDELRDRMVILSVPPDRIGVSEILTWAEALSRNDHPDSRRSVAVYHPAVRVLDPLGGVNERVRTISPCGHVAGVISRLDRVRGAHHTPANAPAYEAVDVEVGYDAAAQGRLTGAGVNLVRCTPGRGLQVWGGRTLHDAPAHRFVAHRRLIHRLVRAARRVAEPLVFDTNGPEVWLAIARAMTSVLLEAFRSGALKGAKPDEAFRVRCDEKTNPPSERDLGRVLCEIDVAPAAPMEFIVLRIALGGDGALEVFEQ